MKTKILSVLALILFATSSYSQLPPGKNPGGKGWADSFAANGLCWCDTTFDHDLGNVNKVWFVINGKRRNIKDVCDELKKHPKVRNYRRGDPIYNDVQCGNGPPNTAIDEKQCPGRVDKGRNGCSEIGPRWDLAWLASRPRFDGNGTNPNPNPNPPSTSQSAFKNHSIPGKIQAEDYDNGGQGVAYSDANSANNGGQGRTNQGVDLEKTTDNGGGTNVGWIANGEWLEYTVANVSAGNYNVKFRVAANNGNNKSIKAKLGNKNLGSVSVPNTGGWQNWQDVSINNVSISGGKQILRLDVSGGSCNINWVEFNKTTTSTPTPPTTGGNGDYVIRAKGVTGEEQITLRINNQDVKTFTLSKSWANYTANSNASGSVRVAFVNDMSGRDLEIDYLDRNGTRYQAENQSVNTSAWLNGTCGGGSNSQWMHCFGYIEFATTGSKSAFIKNTTGKMELFPNPAKNVINLNLGSLITSGKLTVFDNLGRPVRNIDVSNQKALTIDVEALPVGLYHVTLLADAEYKSASFVKSL